MMVKEKTNDEKKEEKLESFTKNVQKVVNTCFRNLNPLTCPKAFLSSKIINLTRYTKKANFDLGEGGGGGFRNYKQQSLVDFL
jgi:hypothetical protein